MRRFFWILVIFILSIWLGLTISEDPGYAFFSYQHWSVEMPLWFAVISFLIVLWILYGILRFFDGIDMIWIRCRHWLQLRRKHQSYSKTNRGLIELVEGQWKSAESYLVEGVAQSDAPLINYLAAAIAAQEQHAYDRRDSYLSRAHHFAPKANVAIGLMQARLQLDQGQLEQALATLNYVLRTAPKHPVVLKLLERVYVHLADWKNLLELLPRLHKAKLMTDVELSNLEQHIYQELLLASAKKQEGLIGIHQTWEKIPKKNQKNPEILYCYIKLIFSYPEMSSDIDSLIDKTLQKTWHKDLVRLYGLLDNVDAKKQLARAEAWHKQYGNHAILLLTLGRLCMRCQLWGKARQYFEDSLKLEASADVYAEYGKLLHQLGENNEALQCYRQGLTSIVECSSERICSRC